MPPPTDSMHPQSMGADGQPRQLLKRSHHLKERQRLDTRETRRAYRCSEQYPQMKRSTRSRAERTKVVVKSDTLHLLRRDHVTWWIISFASTTLIPGTPERDPSTMASCHPQQPGLVIRTPTRRPMSFALDIDTPASSSHRK